MAALLLTAHPALAEPDQARQDELSHLVLQDCGSCHGMTLKGGLGGPLRPGDLEGKEEDALTAIILQGIEGTPMPGWEDLLSREEAEWIARELKKGSFTQ